MKAPGILLFSAATFALAGIGAARAGSVAPVGGESFNVKAQIDLTKLTRDDFDAMVTPVARTETTHELVFYDFADTLCDILAAEVTRFTQETGIPAKHVCVDGDAATQ